MSKGLASVAIVAMVLGGAIAMFVNLTGNADSETRGPVVTRPGSNTRIRCRRRISARSTGADSRFDLYGRLFLRKYRAPGSLLDQESGTQNRSCHPAAGRRQPLPRRRSDGVARSAHTANPDANEAKRVSLVDFGQPEGHGCSVSGP